MAVVAAAVAMAAMTATVSPRSHDRATTMTTTTVMTTTRRRAAARTTLPAPVAYRQPKAPRASDAVADAVAAVAVAVAEVRVAATRLVVSLASGLPIPPASLWPQPPPVVAAPTTARETIVALARTVVAEAGVVADVTARIVVGAVAGAAAAKTVGLVPSGSAVTASRSRRRSASRMLRTTCPIALPLSLRTSWTWRGAPSATC